MLVVAEPTQCSIRAADPPNSGVEGSELLESLDAIAVTFGVLAPPTFVIILASVLLAQMVIAIRRRRYGAHLAAFLEKHRRQEGTTAQRLHALMVEYEDDIMEVGAPSSRQELDDAYSHYRKRQESAIRHLDRMSQELLSRRKQESSMDTVAHQVLDNLANQQAAK